MSKKSKILFLICAVSFVILMVLRFIIGGWVTYFWLPFGISVFSFIAAVVIDFRFYYEFLTLKTTRNGMNMGALISIAFAVALSANYLAHRFNRTFDMTEEKLNSLSEQTLQILKPLNSDLTFTILYRGNDELEQRELAKGNLNLFVTHSNRIKVRSLNVYENVAQAKAYFPSQDQVRFAVVAELNEKKVFVEEGLTEGQIASAIVKLTRTQPKTIYFITGHGEASIDETGEKALSQLRQGLEEMSFKVAPLRLATGDTLPENKSESILALIGPQTSFLESELQSIRDYVKDGGALFMALDPGRSHGLAQLTKSFGIEFKNNYITTEQLQQLGLATVGADYDRASDITRRFSIGFLTLFLEVSEVARAPDTDTAWTTTELVKSEPQAFIINNVAKGAVASSAGAHVLGMQIEIPSGPDNKLKSRVVVFGDSDFLTNRAFSQMGNRDLALNIFASLGQESELAGIRPKQAKGSSLILTRNGQITILTAGIGLPVLLLLFSGFFWHRRRNL